MYSFMTIQSEKGGTLLVRLNQKSGAAWYAADGKWWEIVEQKPTAKKGGVDG